MQAAGLDLTLDVHGTEHRLDRGIEWIAKPGRDGLLPAAVNADRNPLEVNVPGPAALRETEELDSGWGRCAAAAPSSARVSRLSGCVCGA